MTSRGKPWKPPQAVSVGVGGVLAKLELEARRVELNACEAWTDSVGESIARRSAAVRLARGTLFVTVESPAWVHELHFIEREIVERLNRRFRERQPAGPPEPVKRLRLQLGTLPAPRPPPPAKPVRRPPTPEERRATDARLEGVRDPELREAARRLLLATAQSRQDP